MVWEARAPGFDLTGCRCIADALAHNQRGAKDPAVQGDETRVEHLEIRFLPGVWQERYQKMVAEV